MTLLELLIVLAVVVAIVFVALPTLNPSDVEARINFAKDSLRYLHGREQAYFSTHGTYAPLSKLAADPALGIDYDQRFAEDNPTVNGIAFRGPASEQMIFEIVAVLPDSSQYRIDQTGEVSAQQR